MTASVEDMVSLALFARVVETGSFTAAARAAGLSKSVVSQRLGKLEERMGVRLLHRTTRRLSLTDVGRSVYEHSARLVAAADAAAEAAEGASGEPHGTLRLSAPVTLGQTHLAPVIVDFLREHPRVAIEMTASDRLVDLVGEGFDLAVRITRLRDSSLIARRLASDRVVVCGSPAYLARAGTPERPEDLAHHECLRYSLLRPGVEWRFRDKRGQHAVPVHGNFTANDGTMLRAAALAGLGLTVLPYFMVACDVAAGALRTVLDDHKSDDIGIYAVWPARRQVPAKVRALVDFLAARFTGAWQRRPPAAVAARAA